MRIPAAFLDASKEEDMRPAKIVGIRRTVILNPSEGYDLCLGTIPIEQ